MAEFSVFHPHMYNHLKKNSPSLMLARFAKFFLQLLGWQTPTNETGRVLKESVKNFSSLLVVYPCSTGWDLLILWTFLSSEIPNVNWWLLREKLPWWFFRILPQKRRVADTLATAITFNHRNFCDVYLVPEDMISVEEIPRIAESVAIIGANYHPNVRRVHISAQSSKYETSVDYLPYYLSQFLRLNPGNFPVISPTYFKREGITYKPCLSGAMILSAFDPLAVSYLANFFAAGVLMPLCYEICATSMLINLWLLCTKRHSAQIFLQSWVVVHMAIKIMTGDPQPLLGILLALQMWVMIRVREAVFDWTTANINPRLVASYSLSITLLIYSLAY